MIRWPVRTGHPLSNRRAAGPTCRRASMASRKPYAARGVTPCTIRHAHWDARHVAADSRYRNAAVGWRKRRRTACANTAPSVASQRKSVRRPAGDPTFDIRRLAVLQPARRQRRASGTPRDSKVNTVGGRAFSIRAACLSGKPTALEAHYSVRDTGQSGRIDRIVSHRVRSCSYGTPACLQFSPEDGHRARWGSGQHSVLGCTMNCRGRLQDSRFTSWRPI